MSIAIIPARSGSKRIPLKNIREFKGQPMMSWAIQTALESACFERVIVSTDDLHIAEIARDSGAETPFARPAALADDHTPTIPVVQHAIEELALGDEVAVCCIYPTAPFLRASDLQSGLDRLRQGDAKYVFPVTRYGFPIQRSLRRDTQGNVEMFDPSAFNTRSQDLEEAWHDAGQFYWALASTWRTGTPIFQTNAAGIELPRYRVQDIDTEEDWARAEIMFDALTKKPH